jgi:hypothetical protein
MGYAMLFLSHPRRPDEEKLSARSGVAEGLQDLLGGERRCEVAGSYLFLQIWGDKPDVRIVAEPALDPVADDRPGPVDLLTAAFFL